MKKLFTLLIICLFYFYTKAQTTVSLGAGTTLPSSAMKTNNNMGNLTNFTLGAYVPLFEYGGATGGVISFGLNARGEYFTGNSAYNLSTYKPFNITGQSGIPPITAKGSGSPKQAGFKTEAGAQANFSFGPYTISPILNLAYINLKQKAFTVVQNTSVNGQNYEHNLYSQAETKTSGVGAVATLSHRYKFGRDNKFSVFAETNYMFGPSVTTQSAMLIPEGGANAQGNYNINQMNFGRQTSQTKNTKFNGFGVNAGIGIALGKNSGSKTTRRRVEVLKSNKTGDPNAKAIENPLYSGGSGGSQNPLAEKLIKADAGVTSPNSNQGGNNPNAKEGSTKVKCDCGTDIYGKDADACKRICQFLKDGTYATFSKIELEEIKENYLNAIFIEENGVKIPDPKKLKLAAKASDLVGQKVSITKAGKSYAFLGNQDDLIKILTIPSNRATGCTDCDEAATCENSYHRDCCCSNGFCWCFLCVEKATLSELPGDLKVANSNGEGTSNQGGNNPNAKEGNTKAKCDCGTDIYGKDADACKRICQFLKDGTYSSYIYTGIKNGDITLPAVNEKGEYRYFTYTSDFTISAVEICKPLGVKQLTIKEGIYNIDRTNPKLGGKLILDLKEEIPAKSIINKEPIALKSYNPKGQDCKGIGNACFFVTSPLNNRDMLQDFTLTPILENGVCKKIEVQYKGAGSPKAQGF